MSWKTSYGLLTSFHTKLSHFMQDCLTVWYTIFKLSRKAISRTINSNQTTGMRLAKVLTLEHSWPFLKSMAAKTASVFITPGHLRCSILLPWILLMPQEFSLLPMGTWSSSKTRSILKFISLILSEVSQPLMEKRTIVWGFRPKNCRTIKTF